VTSESVDEYIEAIYRLGGQANTVPVSEVAQRLNISVVSTNEMVKRLVSRGLVEYEPYRGILLTAAGQEHALRIVRCHRLWERFLADYLGLPWDQIHEEACRLEHVTSPEVEGRLATFLGDPASCPHGSPVPDAHRQLAEQETELRLADLTEGQQAMVSRVSVEDSTLLRYIADLGLRPNVVIEVEKVAPFGGPITLRIGEVRQVVGGQVISAIHVRLVR